MADIGCYALGAVPPYNAVETIVCMGASIGMARGASLAGIKNSIGVIGDSTFLHSGMTNLVDAISTHTIQYSLPYTFCLDNRWSRQDILL